MKHGCQTPAAARSSGSSRKRLLTLGETQLVAPEGLQTLGLTPGQTTQHSVNSRILNNPFNCRHRQLVSNAYHIQLPLINSRQTNSSPVEVVKGPTVSPLATLPKANRLNPQILPPVLSDSDSDYGIISLLDRRLIPVGSQLSLDQSPVSSVKVPIHTVNEQFPQHQQRSRSHCDNRTQLAVIKRKSATDRRQLLLNKSQTAVPVTLIEIPSQPEPPPTTPASVGCEIRSFRFACQNGKVKEYSDEFIAFKEHYSQASWGSIVTMLHHLEKFLKQYSVPVAFVNGDRLVELSLELELCQKPSVSDLLSVIVNRDDVEALIYKSGRRMYCGNQHLAASKIQATYRMHREHGRYVEYRRRKWAAGVFAISWIMCIKMAKVRKQLKQSRLRQLDAFRVRSKQLADNWNHLKASKHTVIHIPSLGYTYERRQTLTDFDVAQNAQMCRLCDIHDSNVDVIYVSPVAIGDEMIQYYERLLGLSPAIKSGNADDQSDLRSRFTIITPEAAKSFKDRRMCLSSLLKYSPRALKRIKSLIHGRPAYIISGVPHADDVYISDYLDVPVLSPEPEVARLYSTKSGAKRIFSASGVVLPPGELDIYSLQQMYEILSQLIVDNLSVYRWLFKIDDEFDGRGIAYIDISQHLQCYVWCVKEAQRYGADKWRKKWAQEAAYLKIMNELPLVLSDYAKPSNTKAYPDWSTFIEAFLSQGGVIEACPPSDSVTSVSVGLLIQPGAAGAQLVASGDQIHADSQLACWGLSMPQSSVDPTVLNDACFKIAESCRVRGIVGYITIDFVTFINPLTMQQELWATDLDLCYTDTICMAHLIEFATGTRFESTTHMLTVRCIRSEDTKTRQRTDSRQEQKSVFVNRYAAFSLRLYHSNLTMVHYSVFFQMCRAHGIGYDIKEKQGTLFSLVDSTKREHLGMLSISDSLQSVLTTFANNLSIIHQEISAPNMQGITNFKAAIKDIESILGTTVDNACNDDNNN
jgi:hypothetical protein